METEPGFGIFSHRRSAAQLSALTSNRSLPQRVTVVHTLQMEQNRAFMGCPGNLTPTRWESVCCILNKTPTEVLASLWRDGWLSGTDAKHRPWAEERMVHACVDFGAQWGFWSLGDGRLRGTELS